MRAFLAAELDEAGKSAAATLLVRLRRLDSRSVKWVSPENLHITLKFLGDVTDAEARSAGEILSDAASGLMKKPMRFAGVGMFPNERRPRVVHLMADDPDGFLKALNKNLERRIEEKIGIPAENRRFVPHITLCRARGDRIEDRLLKALTEPHHEAEKPFAVTAITFFESILKPDGPTYKTIRRIGLSDE
ncbi:MAG TPA: RNA 2',3'-cyclic phosphodiesterase [Candidatus Brocadiia bacterium]|nr:RNA 2',3'-cyclic phosphodiesterase [Candidatus Brocadiia bacterium]